MGFSNTKHQISDITTPRAALGILVFIFRNQTPSVQTCVNVCVCVCFGFVTPAHVFVFDCDDARAQSYWFWRSRFRPSRNWRLCISGHWTWELQSRSSVEAGKNRWKWRWCKWSADFKAQEPFICLPFLTTYCREAAGFAVCVCVLK